MTSPRDDLGAHNRRRRLGRERNERIQCVAKLRRLHVVSETTKGCVAQAGAPLWQFAVAFAEMTCQNARLVLLAFTSLAVLPRFGKSHRDAVLVGLSGHIIRGDPSRCQSPLVRHSREERINRHCPGYAVAELSELPQMDRRTRFFINGIL